MNPQYVNAVSMAALATLHRQVYGSESHETHAVRRPRVLARVRGVIGRQLITVGMVFVGPQIESGHE